MRTAERIRMNVSTLDRTTISKTVRAFLKNRRPELALRSKLDYGFRYFEQSVELVEIRPRMGGKPGKAEHAFAKATYVKPKRIWKIYWMRANLRWHPYEPPTVRSLEAFLKLVNEDKNGCFFG
jgi:hypothetical protein